MIKKTLEKLDLFGLFCYNIHMKKVVDFNRISKEKLYELYLEEVKRCEALEAKFFKLELELADKVRKLEEANFQLIQRNKKIFGKKRETNKNDKNDFNEAENGSFEESQAKAAEPRRRTL